MCGCESVCGRVRGSVCGFVAEIKVRERAGYEHQCVHKFVCDYDYTWIVSVCIGLYRPTIVDSE